MDEVVSGVEIYSEFPRRYLNAYVVGDVLVDAGTRLWGGRLLDQLRTRELDAHVLTHAHPDHQGTSARVCRAFELPLLCHPEERDVAETGYTAAQMPNNWSNRLLQRVSAGPGHPVERTLSEGDTVGGFEVVETPGNAPGHISLWRERDGVVVLGDVLANIDLLTGQTGLTTLPDRFTDDPSESVASAQKIADLEPDVICFGHGPPLRDGDRFQEFAASLICR